MFTNTDYVTDAFIGNFTSAISSNYSNCVNINKYRMLLYCTIM